MRHGQERVRCERVLSYHRRFRDDIDVLTSVHRSTRHAAALAVAFVVLSGPGIWTRTHGRVPSYVPATMALACLLAALVVWWGRADNAGVAGGRARGSLPLAATAIACALLIAGAWQWLEVMLRNPIDPNRADMLPVIDAALRRVLQGHNPYTIYHVPWEAPLGYGPVLWAPFLIPHGLHLDLRLATIVGALVVPAWCGVAAIVEARRGRALAASAWLVLLAAVLLNPDLTYFITVGHTPVYWPLLPLFAVLTVAERWSAAAFTLGLLVVGRSTMAAGVPVFFVHLWLHDRPAFARAAAWALLPIAVLMGPFAASDPHEVWYGMVAVYPRVIKEAVWSDPTGAIAHTIGLTGWLVAHGLDRFVEAAQAGVVVAVWAAAWLALRRGARPLPWMALAVLAFCMTTLWPLYYIYLDVLMLFVASAAAEALGPLPPMRRASAFAGTLTAAVAIVAGLVVTAVPRYPRLDFTARNAYRWLYEGFAFSRREGEPALPWIWGTDARVAIPRRAPSASDVLVTSEPVIAPGTVVQRVTATLNGHLLGAVDARAGWQTLRFVAPASAWKTGSNDFALHCSSSTSPVMIGMSDDPRHLSLAIRAVDVVSATAATVQ